MVSFHYILVSLVGTVVVLQLPTADHLGSVEMVETAGGDNNGNGMR